MGLPASSEEVDKVIREMLAEGEIDDGLHMFPQLFPEISKDGYCGEGYEKARDKILTRMKALLWMAGDDYDEFVDGQEEGKLSEERWDEIQAIMKWAGLETR